MKKILLTFALILLIMNLVQGKESFYIERMTALSNDDISLVVYKRNGDGSYDRVEVIRVDTNGQILSYADCKNLIRESDHQLMAIPLLMDMDNKVWLKTEGMIGKISLEKLDMLKNSVEDNLEYLTGPDEEGILLGKDTIFILPNIMSQNMGKSWRKLFGNVDYFPKENCEDGSILLDNYAMELPSFTLYQATVKHSDKGVNKIVLSKFDLAKRKWMIDDFITLNKNEKPPLTMHFPFLISEKYVVMSDDFEKDYRVIIVYDRNQKKYKYYRDVARECSDYDITGLIPEAIVEDRLFCHCPIGGYVIFDLKTGNLQKGKFSNSVCMFYQPPSLKYLLLNSEGKLFISFNKGDSWKEILDVNDREKVETMTKKIKRTGG